MAKMKKYTVIGIWEDSSDQPFAEVIYAENVEHAEEEARNWAREEAPEGPKIIIAGVVDGAVVVH